MSCPHHHRKVLIVDEPSILNVLLVLLAHLGCDSDVTSGAEMALSMIRQESYDAVLLDLRCSHLPAEEMVEKIKELRPNLLGRVLVITGEVTDPRTLEVIERNCLLHVSEKRLMEELWRLLRNLLGFSGSPADFAA